MCLSCGIQITKYDLNQETYFAELDIIPYILSSSEPGTSRSVDRQPPANSSSAASAIQMTEDILDIAELPDCNSGKPEWSKL